MNKKSSKHLSPSKKSGGLMGMVQNLGRSSSSSNVHRLLASKEKGKERKADHANCEKSFSIPLDLPMSGVRRGSTGFADGEEGGTLGHFASHHAMRTSSLAYALCDSPTNTKKGVSSSGKQKTFFGRRGSAAADEVQDSGVGTEPSISKKNMASSAFARLRNKGVEKSGGKNEQKLPGENFFHSAKNGGFCGEDLLHRIDTALKLLPKLAQVSKFKLNEPA